MQKCKNANCKIVSDNNHHFKAYETSKKLINNKWLTVKNTTAYYDYIKAVKSFVVQCQGF